MTVYRTPLIASLTLFVVASLYASYLMSPVAAAEGNQIISIPEGASVRDIGTLLYQARLVRSRAAFTLASFMTGSAHRLKSGTYLISPSLTTPDIVQKITEGATPVTTLVVEGKALRDIDHDLARAGVILPDGITNLPVSDLVADYPFLNGVSSLEGFLFPDTYELVPGEARPVAKRFLDTFEDKVFPVLTEGRSAADRALWYRDLILASILEREVTSHADRRIVAGILLKRLSIKMPLQVDATVIYARCGERFDNCPPLTKADFSVDSPFNTYLYRGVPPAPIANPGLDAILAVRNPKASSYLYYLSDPATGKTIFSETLEEHAVARARYLHL